VKADHLGQCRQSLQGRSVSRQPAVGTALSHRQRHTGRLCHEMGACYLWLVRTLTTGSLALVACAVVGCSVVAGLGDFEDRLTSGTGGATGGGGASSSGGATGGGGASSSGGGVGGASSSSGGGAGGAGATGGSGLGGSGGAGYPCDAGFELPGGGITAGQSFELSYSDPVAWAYIEMIVSGPGNPVATGTGIVPGPPAVWSYSVSGHDTGLLTFEFMHDCVPGPCQVVAQCQAWSHE